MSKNNDNATALLHKWRDGDIAARDALLGLLYDDLRRVARNMLRDDGVSRELRATELVNESAIRLLGSHDIDWHDRAHFMAVSATVMRRVLIDCARAMRSGKRDGKNVTLLTALGTEPRAIELLALDDALAELEVVSADRARIVELRFYGGMSHEEVASALDVSVSTVKRGWRAAKAWLLDRLQSDGVDVG